mmetsp:Transcript_15750/g.54944  ORF Transcript_15750/g.54944 Transcript_15750/m.54944 type:complete len:248 (+) Transcript_15750:161-904(+)
MGVPEQLPDSPVPSVHRQGGAAQEHAGLPADGAGQDAHRGRADAQLLSLVPDGPDHLHGADAAFSGAADRGVPQGRGHPGDGDGGAVRFDGVRGPAAALARPPRLLLHAADGVQRPEDGCAGPAARRPRRLRRGAQSAEEVRLLRSPQPHRRAPMPLSRPRAVGDARLDRGRRAGGHRQPPHLERRDAHGGRRGSGAAHARPPRGKSLLRRDGSVGGPRARRRAGEAGGAVRLAALQGRLAAHRRLP